MNGIKVREGDFRCMNCVDVCSYEREADASLDAGQLCTYCYGPVIQPEALEVEQAPEATPRATVTGEGPEPRSIRFETVTCRRCDGERRNPAWGRVAGGWCFQCGGAGWQYTQAGTAALEAFEALRDERLGTTYGEIAIGEAYKRNEKWYEKTGEAFLHADYPVHRHNGAITRQIWREIAARHKGATLVY